MLTIVFYFVKLCANNIDNLIKFQKLKQNLKFKLIRCRNEYFLIQILTLIVLINIYEF